MCFENTLGVVVFFFILKGLQFDCHPPAHTKIARSDLRQYSYNICLNKYEWDLHGIVYICGFSAKVTIALLLLIRKTE